MTKGVIDVRDKDGRSLSRGTGWFLRPDVVVTALHVVGKLQPRGWMHAVPGEEDATYGFVSAGMPKLTLRPACFDAAADLALLRCEPPLSDVAEVLLAEVFPQGAEWYADGYPGFETTGQEWTLKGQIVKLRGDRLQLVITEGTQVSWEGVSGSALRVGHRVAGLISAETSGTNTVWAAAASAIHRLVATYDAATETVGLSGGSFVWNTDRETLLETTRGRSEAAKLRDRVAAIGTGRPQWSLPSSVLEDLQRYGVGPIQEGYSRLVRRELAETGTRLYDPWDEFEELLFTGRYSADRFGGRAEQLRALDEFVETGEGGYFFVTGSAGLGKTALLAEWLRCFQARGERPAFHFLTKRPAKFLDKPYSEPSCLQSLCRQLLDLNDLGGNLPPEMDGLRKLYRRLLTLPHPPDQRMVVVLDGLDEALPDWTPGCAMFPPLPNGVHVIFSARPVANKDWLRDLRLDLVPAQKVVLDRLNPAEIRDVLRRSGFAQMPGVGFQPLCDTVADVTHGDPDYVADVLDFVLELLKEGNIDVVSAIKGLPPGHGDYLRQWWKSASEDLHEWAFDDLMGTLAVLREPLAADDLARVSEEDGLRKSDIDRLLERAGRYVEGSPRTGYHLVRTRIIELVNDRLEDRMDVYRRRVADFCRRWDSPTMSASARRYAVRNAVAHLLQQDDLKGAVALLDARFIAAKWGVDGSYVSLLTDLDALLDFAQAHPDNREAMYRAPAFAVMRESARDLMRSLPGPLYACWIRLKGRSQIADLLNALPTYRGEARKPLLAVANEIFEMFPAEEKGAPDRVWAGELLGRTIGLMPLVRTALWKLETWSEICRLLATYRVQPAQLKKILEQAEAFMEQIAERDANLKAACLAHLAKAILPWDREASLGFLKRAETLTQDLPMGDRAMVYAIAFRVYRVLNSSRGEQLASETTKSLQDVGGTSLSGEPLIDLLAAWAPEPATGPPVDIARVLAERYLANPKGSSWFVPPALLFRFGLDKLAWQIMAKLAFKESTDFVARQLMDCLSAAPNQSDTIRPLILSRYTDCVAAPNVARALMHAGYWAEALAVLKRLPGKDQQEVVADCIEVVLRQPTSAQRDAAVDELVNLLEPGTEVGWAEDAARSALALARANLPQARRVYGMSLCSSLVQLPEGDADDIQFLVALALSTAGEYDKALAVVHDCNGLLGRMAGMVSLLNATPAGSEEQEQIAAEINRQLAGAQQDPSLKATLVLAGEAGERLAASNAQIAAGLADAIENLGRSSLASLSAAAKVRVLLNPGSGPSRARELVEHIVSGGERPAMEDIQAACAVVIRTTFQDPDTMRGLVDRLQVWGTKLQKGDRVQALAGLLGAAAEVDAGRAANIVNEVLKILRPVEGVPTPTSKAEAYGDRFVRLLAELTGDRWPWMRQFKSLLDGFVDASTALPETLLLDSLAGVWIWLLALPAGRDEFEAAAEGYLAAIARLPRERSSTVEHLVENVPSALQAKLMTDRFSTFCSAASIDLATKGHAKAARLLSQHIQPNDDRGLATLQIDACEFFHSLQDRSFLEDALFQMAKDKPNKLIAAMTVKMVRENKIGQVFNGIFDPLKEWNLSKLQEQSGLESGKKTSPPRRYLLLDRLKYFVFAALTQWGIEAGTLIVNALKELDDHLVDAAFLIAEAYAADSVT